MCVSSNPKSSVVCQHPSLDTCLRSDYFSITFENSYDSPKKAIADWGTSSGVVIAGAGGGLGHIAVQLASRGMAMRVIGIDAPSKKSVVIDCGAEHFVDVTAHDDKSIAEEVMKVTGGLGAQAVIVCTASNKAYAQALDFIKFDGTVVCVGMPVRIHSA